MQATMFEGYICSEMRFFGQVKPMRVSRLVKTGIPGLDEILGGGIPEGNIVLISGQCGAGKTLFALQFLYSGAVEFGERGAYIALDEKPELVRKRARPFGWDFRDLELDDKIAILDAYATLAKLPTAEKIKVLGPLETTSFITGVLETLEKVSAKRVVIDSITAFAYQFVDPKKIRDVITRIFAILRELKCTAIITSEIEPGEGKLSRWGVEEFLADGVIRLFSYTSKSESRALRIVKMKGAKHPLRPVPFRITENGIVVEKPQMLLTQPVEKPKVKRFYY
jgi:KaiC/GvpD/RAD55 family RecA-like ATPase